MELVYKNEKLLFAIAAVIATVFWVALLVGTVGIALLYLLLFYLFFLFAHSAFISHLKGTGVKITQEQYPDLHDSLVRGCKTIGLETIPDAYVLRTDFFNALATRFLGRHFVVLFSDVVDALEDQPAAIDFYIGHELGHIHRKHLKWGPFLAPALVLPLLGCALRRAEEYTCDRYGVACSASEADIQSAMAAIAAGNTRWKTLNLKSYLQQINDTKGFWLSFNELTSDYPWLTKRMAAGLAMKRGQAIKFPSRNVFAGLLSLFVPRFGSNGAASLLVAVAIVGVLAAVALPAYQDYTERMKLAAVMVAVEPVQQQVTQYAEEHRQWPASLQDLGYENEQLSDEAMSYEIAIHEDGMVGAKVGTTGDGEPKYLVLEPAFENDAVIWSCYGQGIPEKLVPPRCR